MCSIDDIEQYKIVDDIEQYKQYKIVDKKCNV